MTSNRHVLKKKAERESKELQKFEGKWWKLYPTLRGALPIITQPSATNKSGKRVLLDHHAIRQQIPQQQVHEIM
jgi:hypothetical protein